MDGWEAAREEGWEGEEGKKGMQGGRSDGRGRKGRREDGGREDGWMDGWGVERERKKRGSKIQSLLKMYCKYSAIPC